MLMPARGEGSVAHAYMHIVYEVLMLCLEMRPLASACISWAEGRRSYLVQGWEVQTRQGLAELRMSANCRIKPHFTKAAQ